MKTCPKCGSDQQGPPIPAEHFVHLPDCPLPTGTERFRRCFCLPYGDMPVEERFYSRTIMVEIPGIYDGGLFHQCPDCGGRWHRWPEGDQLRAKAAPFVGVA